MAGPIQILTTEVDGDDGLIVTFSDGTTGGFVVEELLDMRPVREKAEGPEARTVGQGLPTKIRDGTASPVAS